MDDWVFYVTSVQRMLEAQKIEDYRKPSSESITGPGCETLGAVEIKSRDLMRYIGTLTTGGKLLKIFKNFVLFAHALQIVCQVRNRPLL